MVSMVLVRTSIKTGNPHFFKMCQIKSELLHFMKLPAEYDLDLEHQIVRFLELGLLHFDLDIGTLSNISNNEYTVYKQVSPGDVPLADGAVTSRLMMDLDDLPVVDNPNGERWNERTHFHVL